MKFLQLIVTALAGMACFAYSNADNSTPLRLKYNSPAQYFEESLVMGNGNIGMAIYGGVESERLSLNDITLWTGEPCLEVAEPEAYTSILKVRECLEREDYKGADEANLSIQGKGSEIYMPLGNLTMAFDYPETIETTNYHRVLSLNDAVSSVSFDKYDTHYLRQYFVSAPDSVIAIRLSVSGPDRINGKIKFDSQLPYVINTIGDTIVADGYAAYRTYSEWENGKYGTDRFIYDPMRGIHFRTAIVPVNISGEGTVNIDCNGEILLSNCSDIMFLLTNVTSFNGHDKNPMTEGRNYKHLALQRLTSASTKDYETLLESHTSDYTKLFNRVSLNLGTTDKAISSLPTDEQLKLYTDRGDFNPELETLFFQYGRYLLLSCSRTDGVPANLQGLWNEKIVPPWSSNYTVNINLEENYWPAEVTNLSELHKPLISFINAMLTTGYDTARHYYGIENGWCAGHNSDIWALTNPIGRHINDPRWANWNMAAAWLTTHIWERYSFTKDINELRISYPALRDAALFCLDWMIEKDGHLITSPCTSPENRFIDNGGNAAATHYGGASDLAMIRECLSDTRKAAVALDVDRPLIKRIDNALNHILPYRVNSDGSLREWYHEFRDEDPQHRHQSHLYGLYPGHHISTSATPDLANAADMTLTIKGNNTTGWSTGWRTNLYARLGNANRAYFMYRRLLQYVSPDEYNGDDARRGGGTYPNLLGAHSPFQIDSNFGGCAGVAEMLMQSDDDGNIILLPAIPDQWKDGSVTGLCARAGFIIDMKWIDGKIQSYTLTARDKGKARVEANCKIRSHKLSKGESKTITLF